MAEQTKRYRTPSEYPAGIDDFADIRENNRMYVDKTAYVYQMTRLSYVFLGRPRRFGKSLLCSTLEAYFKGKRELFKGLAIDSPEMETEWKEYPVLRFNISLLKDSVIDKMEEALFLQLYRYEKIYGFGKYESTPGSKLAGLIERAHKQTGLKTVIIVDEYDSAMLAHLHDTDENKLEVRRIMQEFYTPLKACSEHIRFVFITGITKFSQMSTFSAVNNLTNISMSPRYAGICGITKTEFEELFKDDIEQLSNRLKMSYEQCLGELKRWYDGYHFSKASDDVYNPYSLMKAFSLQEIAPYWFTSGTCTFLINEMKSHNTQVHTLDGSKVPATSFDLPVEEQTDALPLIYQSGYLTIKKHNSITNTYTLGIPNNEVRSGLMENVFVMLTGTSSNANSSYASEFINALYECKYDEAMEYLRAFLASIPNLHQGEGKIKRMDKLDALSTIEALYQVYLYIFFQGMGYQVRTEVEVSHGRVDMVMWIGNHIFVFEFKMSASCQSAIDQIDARQYIEPWRCGKSQITKFAVLFDGDSRNIKDWKFEEVLSE